MAHFAPRPWQGPCLAALGQICFLGAAGLFGLDPVLPQLVALLVVGGIVLAVVSGAWGLHHVAPPLAPVVVALAALLVLGECALGLLVAAFAAVTLVVATGLGLLVSRPGSTFGDADWGTLLVRGGGSFAVWSLGCLALLGYLAWAWLDDDAPGGSGLRRALVARIKAAPWGVQGEW